MASKSNDTDRIIVRYRSLASTTGTSATTDAARTSRVQTLSTAIGESLTFVRQMDGGAYVLRLAERKPMSTARALAQRLMTSADVAYAEPDALAFPMLLPNDALFANQWNLLTPDSTALSINLPQAWEMTTGAPNLTIAIIDTGVLNHADLAGRTVPGYDFISDAQVGNDGDTRDANPADPGDWVTSAESASGYFAGCQPRNSTWHGTHIAGIVGANGNNGIGVAGVNWTSKLLPVRVLGKCGGYLSDIADGIRWAAGLSVAGAPVNANPARVINMSLGGDGSCSPIYQDAINAATNAGAVVVVAAGNSNADVSAVQPANCDNVVAVASTDRSGNRASYSSFGSGVDVAAPGGDSGGSTTMILSTLNTGTTSPVADAYAYYRGTSMAAPQVAGIISLMLSEKPSLTPAQILTLLRGSASGFPAGSTCTILICGAGVSNGEAAVQAASAFGAATPVPTPVPTETATATSTLAPPPTPTRTPLPIATVKPGATQVPTQVPLPGPTATPHSGPLAPTSTPLPPSPTPASTSTPAPEPTRTTSQPVGVQVYLPVLVR